MIQEKKSSLVIVFIIVIAFIASLYLVDFAVDYMQQAFEAKLNKIFEDVNLDISLETEEQK